MLLMFKIAPLTSRQFGFNQEARALKYLQQNGCSCIAKNFSSKFGEIDLVVKDKNGRLLFVEVRYRSNPNFGSPAETVSIRKQSRIRQTAAFFLTKHPRYANFQCRFDVIAIRSERKADAISINWIKNAFC